MNIFSLFFLFKDINKIGTPIQMCRKIIFIFKAALLLVQSKKGWKLQALCLLWEKRTSPVNTDNQDIMRVVFYSVYNISLWLIFLLLQVQIKMFSFVKMIQFANETTSGTRWARFHFLHERQFRIKHDLLIPMSSSLSA